MKGFIFSFLMAMLVFIGCSTNVSVVNEDSSMDKMNNMGGRDSMNKNYTMNGSSSEMENEMSVYFEFDKFTVASHSINTIKKQAKNIIDNNINVKLEGNADERGSDEYNYALALKRAVSVKDMLVGYGVDESKISLISYGESKPKCLEQTQKCFRENRRVDFNLGNK